MSLEATVANLFAKYDADQSGTLHIDDARPLYEQLAAERPDLNLTPEGYEAWFAGIDGDDSKTISPEDLQGYLASVNYAPTH